MSRITAGLGRIAITLVMIAMLSPIATSLAAEVTISISNNLNPRDVAIAPGVTVEWVNLDSERHRMRSVSGPEEFDSGNLERGRVFVHRRSQR